MTTTDDASLERDVREVRSPSDGGVVASLIDATIDDVDRAVSTAKRGLAIWSATPTTERAAVMHAVAKLVRDEIEPLATTISLEMGKPIRQARSEVRNVADLLDFFAEEGLRIAGEIPKLDLKNELPLVLKEPVGVVAAITPFNYPLSLLSWKLGPALICGCSVIAKPDERAPSAALRLAELGVQGGLPAEVFQTLVGGAEIGQSLVTHPGVAKVAFTGGVATGRAVAGAAMGTGKRVTLELGGQCPAIVDHDADLDTAIKALVEHTFNNSGQYCYRVNRIYVHDDIAQEFVARFVGGAAALVVAAGPEERSDIGALCTEASLQRSVRHVEDAVAQGGRVLLGGERLLDGPYANGRFFAPTVVDRCTATMLLMREETFGPVVGIQTVGSLQEAIALANDSAYGLASYVFTRDSGRGLQAARQMEAGSVWVNGVKKAYPQCPFGGVKASGLGREKSHFGLDEYLELKSIYLQLPEL